MKTIAEYLLKSEPNKNSELHFQIIPPLSLCPTEKNVIVLDGLSCPTREKEEEEDSGNTVLKAYCCLNGGQERLFLLSSEDKEKDYIHDWKGETSWELPLEQTLLSDISLRLEPVRKSHPHPSVAQFKVMHSSSSSKHKEYVLICNKTGNDVNDANSFSVPIPRVLQNTRRCYTVSLSSLTYNPYFRLFPFVTGKEEPQYEITWKTEQSLEKKILNYAELFANAQDPEEIFFLAYAFLKNVFVKGNVAELESIEEAPAEKDEEDRTIQLTWIVDAEISLPFMLAQFLSWNDTEDYTQFRFKNVTRRVSEEETTIFTLKQEKMRANLPRLLQIEVDFIADRKNILKTLPVEKYVFNTSDYCTSSSSSKEYHLFRYPGQESLTFTLKTMDGSLAAFENSKSVLYLTLLFKEIKKK